MNTANSLAASSHSLAEWLSWQEALNPAEIELGLERVATVAGRMQLPRPAHVITIGGTNGKGSCAEVVAAVLQAGGKRAGLYTSPHLMRYNERIRVNGNAAADAQIVQAFEQVEAVRDDIPLTYFEFGTLAALQHFHTVGCDAWVLEVGLGGRLDAVNVIDPDVAVITTVDLDHQEWLGDTVEQIAAEKAGIMRAGKPACYGDLPVPRSITERAEQIGARLCWPGAGFAVKSKADAAEWRWEGRSILLEGLPQPQGGDVQLRNQAVALAALEAVDPELLAVLRTGPGLLAGCRLPGRLQRHIDSHRWLLDVGHNPQAARVLREQLAENRPAAVVAGMMADKQARDFARELGAEKSCWYVCPTVGARAAGADELASRLAPVLEHAPRACASVAEAMQMARESTSPGDLILVTGSFGVVGPALQWLGLY